MYRNIRKAMKERVIYAKLTERRTLGGSSLCQTFMKTSPELFCPN
jgi:hypothetical protein